MSSSRPKRPRFSQKRRLQGERLVNTLREYASAFPGFASELQECIERIVEQSQRTRASDRERVLKALREWKGGLGARDIMEDTGLSHWDVRQILYELVATGKVVEMLETLPGKTSTFNARRTLYVLKPHK
jgi:hypothetical protein